MSSEDKTSAHAEPVIMQGLTDDTEGLGRFGNHPDPATDFCIEVEKLESRLHQAQHGLSKPGTEPETVAAVLNDIQRAMDFRVGGDEGAVAAKGILRGLEDQAKSHPPTDAAEIERLRAEVERLTPKPYVSPPGTFNTAELFGAVDVGGDVFVPLLTHLDTVRRHAECDRDRNQAHAERDAALARVAELEAALTPLPDAELDALVVRGEILARGLAQWGDEKPTFSRGDWREIVGFINEAITALRAALAAYDARRG